MADIDPIRLEELAHKWRNGKLTKAEQAEFDSWFSQVKDEPQEFSSNFISDEEMEAALFARIQGKIQPKPIKIQRLWPRIAVAASIALVLFTGTYVLLHHKQPKQQITHNQKPDILPGTNQATLTLANGQKIILSKGLSGKIATQGNMAVRVNSGNAITYIAENDQPVAYNTISTVRGQESPYPLVLADGTKVWLNAASSITFPVAFNGKDRTVKITGEAYFEVVHNAAQPFRVQVKDQTIEDIGTAFNVNAYDDEPQMQTTLISGSIKIGGKTLQPGQAAILKTGSDHILIKAADTEQAMAWKEGYFQIDHADLQTIMRQVSRWYDVDVEYQGNIPEEPFTGRMQRSVNASKFMDMLSFFNLHYKIEGRKIIVLP
jgi:transmembrane sensor